MWCGLHTGYLLSRTLSLSLVRVWMLIGCRTISSGSCSVWEASENDLAMLSLVPSSCRCSAALIVLYQSPATMEESRPVIPARNWICAVDDADHPLCGVADRWSVLAFSIRRSRNFSSSESAWLPYPSPLIIGTLTAISLPFVIRTTALIADLAFWRIWKSVTVRGANTLYHVSFFFCSSLRNHLRLGTRTQQTSALPSDFRACCLHPVLHLCEIQLIPSAMLPDSKVAGKKGVWWAGPCSVYAPVNFRPL